MIVELGPGVENGNCSILADGEGCIGRVASKDPSYSKPSLLAFGNSHVVAGLFNGKPLCTELVFVSSTFHSSGRAK